MSESDRNIILYDGVCALCNRFVKFVMKLDKRGSFYFASQQSEFGKSILSDAPFGTEGIDSIIVYLGADRSYFQESDAVLVVFRLLGFPWTTVSWLQIIPDFIRNSVYRLVARNRYRAFGRYDQCPMAPPEYRNRFLG